VVRCAEAKAQLASAAEALANALLAHVAAEAHTSNHDINAAYQVGARACRVSARAVGPLCCLAGFITSGTHRCPEAEAASAHTISQLTPIDRM